MMPMLPATGVDHVGREVHLPRNVAMSLQLQLSINVQLLTDIPVPPMLERILVSQAILMESADVVQIDV